jgi:thiol-disulfide isomerase/thioredoxin
MYRLLAGLCVLSLATFAVAQDKAPTPKKAAAEFKKLEAEFMTKIRAARTPAAQKELFTTYAPKFLKFAEDNKGTPAAIDALSFPLRMGAPHDAKAVAALSKDYAKKPLSRLVLNILASRSDKESQDLLKAVIDGNPDKKIGAMAVKALISARERDAQTAARINGNPQLREQLEKARGKEFVKGLLDKGEAASTKIKEYQKLLAEKFKGALPEVAVGKPVPEFVSEDIKGKPAKLSDLKGKVVVLDVWATWCPPCKGMIPHSRELVKKMKGKPFIFVSVSADAQKQTLINFMKETEMPWTHWWNGATGGIVEEWEITAYPTIFLIDHKGILREKIVGADSGKVYTVAE